MPTPEEVARQNIDKQLQEGGWVIQSRRGLNLYAARGVAVRECPLDTRDAAIACSYRPKAVGGPAG